jgi:hypothetical protein
VQGGALVDRAARGGGPSDASLAARAATAARRSTQVRQRCQSCEVSRPLGFRVSEGSRSRFATPAGFPLRDGTPYDVGVGICPSFKGHFLSRRAKPSSHDSRLVRRCTRRRRRRRWSEPLPPPHSARPPPPPPPRGRRVRRWRRRGSRARTSSCVASAGTYRNLTRRVSVTRIEGCVRGEAWRTCVTSPRLVEQPWFRRS